MSSRRIVLSRETLDGFLAGDSRACAQLTEFLLQRGRKEGAGHEAEDLAQRLLLDLVMYRDRGALALQSAQELEAYLTTSMRNRYFSVLRKRRPQQLDEALESVLATEAAAGPDGRVRGLEYVETCVSVMRYALERAGAPTAWTVMQRTIERFVFGRDVEDVLIDCGLLNADATAEERKHERENENRRQSRARAAQVDALHRLDESVRSGKTTGTLEAGSRQVQFDADDVRCALRFVQALTRSERADASTPKGKP